MMPPSPVHFSLKISIAVPDTTVLDLAFIAALRAAFSSASFLAAASCAAFAAASWAAFLAAASCAAFASAAS